MCGWNATATWDEIVAVCANLESPLRCVDPETEARMKQEVDQVLRAGDSVGGIFEVVAHGVPPGLGSHVQWDAKLDGQLARAIMSIQAVKAVEIGAGVATPVAMAAKCRTKSATMHRRSGSTARRNRAGGLEGGITNGEDVVVRGYLKPISTLRRALRTADLNTQGSREGGLRALRRMRGAGGRSGGRSDGRAGAGGSVPGKVWRRFAGRDAPKFRRVQRQLDNF